MSDGAGPTRSTDHAFIADLLAESPVPARGILSQTLSDADGVRLVLFAFAAGEELSEHAAGRPAIVHVLQGLASISAGSAVYGAGPGSWLRMAAGTVHAIRAVTPLVMALYLLPVGSSAPSEAGSA